MKCTSVPFDMLDTCGFRGDGCTTSFFNMESHLIHLIKEHRIPVFFRGTGSICVPKNRMEPQMANFELDLPLIRAVIVLRKRRGVILLMAKDMEDNGEKFIRMWFVNPIAGGKRRFVVASACIATPSDGIHPTKQIHQYDNIEAFSSINEVQDLVNSPSSMPCIPDTFHRYFDITAESIGDCCEEINGLPHFTLSFELIQRKIVPRKRHSELEGEIKDQQEDDMMVESGNDGDKSQFPTEVVNEIAAIAKENEQNDVVDSIEEDDSFNDEESLAVSTEKERYEEGTGCLLPFSKRYDTKNSNDEEEQEANKKINDDSTAESKRAKEVKLKEHEMEELREQIRELEANAVREYREGTKQRSYFYMVLAPEDDAILVANNAEAKRKLALAQQYEADASKLRRRLNRARPGSGNFL